MANNVDVKDLNLMDPAVLEEADLVRVHDVSRGQDYGIALSNIFNELAADASSLATIRADIEAGTGTYVQMQVDNVLINGNTISSTAGTDLNLTPLAGQQLVLDGTIEVDAGVVTGVTSIEGGDATLGVDGLDAAQGGAITITGGTSSTGGNAGGAVSLVGGTPGATGVGGAVAITGAAGGATSGKGGAATVTAGAGTNGNASGGSVILQPGAKNGSGLDGGAFNRGTFRFVKMPAPQTATDTASLSDAQMTGGVLVGTPTAAAAYTVRTGTQLKAALPTDLAGDDAFDLVIINLGGTGDDITLTPDTDITIVGNAVVGPIADVATEQECQATFRFRFVSGTTFIAYRVA